MNRRSFRTKPTIVLAVGSLFISAVGCGGSGPAPPVPTIEVKGKLAYKDGRSVEALELAKVWFKHTSKTEFEGVGRVNDDGTFVMTLLAKDKSFAGVPEGTYNVRIEPPLDDDTREPRPDVIHPKYRKFETSGLTATVPIRGELVLFVEPLTR